MEGAVIIVSVLGGMLVLVAIGYVIGLGISPAGSATITVGAPTGNACTDACTAWRTARLALCAARGALAAAISYRDSIFMAWMGVLTAALSFTAAASAAQFIPAVGAAIAAGLFSLAATLLATAAVLGGLYGGAVSAVITRQDDLNKRAGEDGTAVTAVLAACPAATAAACLSMPPC
jgi:hypothetical protein